MAQNLLTAAAIRGAQLRSEDVEIPEWPNEDGTPGKLRLCELRADRQLLMHDLVKDRPDDGMFIIVVFCAADDQGAPLFVQPTRDELGWHNLEDVEMLKGKGLGVLNRLQRIALKLNRGLDPNA